MTSSPVSEEGGTGRPGDAASDSGREEQVDVRLLFVCTGNTCRSPMAGALACRAAERRGLRVEVRTAGTSAVPGRPASTGAVLAAREQDLDLSDHVSTPLSPGLVGWADVVVCMTPSHLEAAAGATDGGEVVLLTDFLPEGDPERGGPVPDPVGGGLEDYREVLQMLRTAVEGLLERAAGP